MISVVCVYNKEDILRNVLLKSLKNQTASFELITLDNGDGKYKSAAEAFNHGGDIAKGDYIMFIHQDMWLGDASCLANAEEVLSSIPNLGVAGVAGQSDKGRNWWERARYSIETFGNTNSPRGRVLKPQEVQTLDECLLVIPRAVFHKLKFDETVFDGWDCYSADYCLSARKLGLKAYVIPVPCSHCCLRASYQRWEFKDLLKFQKRLYEKHRKNYRHIYTWMGEVSWLSLKSTRLMKVLGPFYSRLFPNLNAILKTELSDCRTILDIGCGHASPIARCDVPFSVGVELFEPYLLESQRKSIHSQYMKADIRRLEFKPKSFDAVLAIEVLEHLTKEEGYDLIKRMKDWAVKKIIITTPNAYREQDAYDDNPLQEHKSYWSVGDLRRLGFKVFGSEGWRRLRGHKGSIKYRPAFVWGIVSALTQKITYYYPKKAFQLLAIRNVGKFDKK